MKKLLVLTVALFIIFALGACSPDEKNNETLIISQKSPDGSYTLYLYQIGEPVWSFGPVKAKLVLQNADGEVVDEESFELFNDGVGVHTGNLKQVSWGDAEVDILMDADEHPEEHYILTYSGN